LSPDGKAFAIVSRGEGRVINVADGTESVSFSLDNPDIYETALSPLGTILAIGSKDGSISLWNTATGTRQADCNTQGGWVTCLAFSPDGKTLTSGHFSGTIKLWDVGSMEQLQSLKGHAKDLMHCVMDVKYSADGKTLASVGMWSTIKLWDTETGKNMSTIEVPVEAGSLNMALSPNGKTIAYVGDDEVVRLWDVVAEKNIAAYPFGYHPPSQVVITFDRIIQKFRPRKSGARVGNWENVLGLSFTAKNQPLAFVVDDRLPGTLNMWCLNDLPKVPK
jgi:WD40 repeat protein